MLLNTKGKEFFKKMMLFQGIKDILRTNKNIKFLARVRKENIRSLNFLKNILLVLILKMKFINLNIKIKNNE